MGEAGSEGLGVAGEGEVGDGIAFGLEVVDD